MSCAQFHDVGSRNTRPGEGYVAGTVLQTGSGVAKAKKVLVDIVIGHVIKRKDSARHSLGARAGRPYRHALALQVGNALDALINGKNLDNLREKAEARLNLRAIHPFECILAMLRVIQSACRNKAKINLAINQQEGVFNRAAGRFGGA